MAVAISHLAYCNPFLPDRMKFEAEALGERFIPGDAVWNALSNASPRTLSAFLGSAARANKYFSTR